jgi:hypothetical protein
MNAFYPKLIAGILLFAVIGLLTGFAVGMFFFIATLPMVALFPEPSSAPQVAIMLAAILGFATACVVIALGTGAWKKRVQADLYREHGSKFVPGASRPPRWQDPPMHRQLNRR